jgi:hypothetical protein
MLEVKGSRNAIPKAIVSSGISISLHNSSVRVFLTRQPRHHLPQPRQFVNFMLQGLYY